MIDQDFWRDKRVFLTGHTGFKGSWLSLWLGIYPGIRKEQLDYMAAKMEDFFGVGW